MCPCDNGFKNDWHRGTGEKQQRMIFSFDELIQISSEYRYFSSSESPGLLLAACLASILASVYSANKTVMSDPFSLPRFFFIADSPFWADFFLRPYTFIFYNILQYLPNTCTILVLSTLSSSRNFAIVSSTKLGKLPSTTQLIWTHSYGSSFLCSSSSHLTLTSMPYMHNMPHMQTNHVLSKFYHLFTATPRLTLSILHCCLPPRTLLSWFLLHSQFHHFYRLSHIISLQTLLSSYEMHC